MDSNCATEVDTYCYQAVTDLLEGANHVLQPRGLKQSALEVRNPAALVYYAGGILISALLFPLLYEGDRVVPVPIKIPPNHVEDSLELETATAIIVVTDDATPQMTITAPPEQDKATGYANPSQHPLKPLPCFFVRVTGLTFNCEVLQS